MTQHLNIHETLLLLGLKTGIIYGKGSPHRPGSKTLDEMLLHLKERELVIEGACYDDLDWELTTKGRKLTTWIVKHAAWTSEFVPCVYG